MGYIVDISHHQKSAKINWPEFAKHVDMLIIRVQYGSLSKDKEYDNHTANAIKYGIPFYTYAFPRFVSVEDARIEARDAVKRQHPKSLGMAIDIEPEYVDGKPTGITKLPKNIRLEGIKAFVDELRKQGVKRVGAYIAHHIYESWGLAEIIDLFDFIWIPRYGQNNGQPNIKPDYPCDIWQYTSVGRVPGYDGNLDLNMLIGKKDLSWFTGIKIETKPQEKPKEQTKKESKEVKRYKVVKTINGYYTAADAKQRKNAKAKVEPGDYFVFNESNGMINVTKKNGIPGAWINPNDNKVTSAKSSSNAKFKVGDKVKIKKSAEKYYTGERIPNWVKNGKYTITQIKTNPDRALLKEIISWVYLKDLEK